LGKLRYYLPNAITSVGIAFAAISIQRSIDGQYRTAAWWAMYCLLTDKLDGLAARRLNASTPFGAQMDSFADFFSFGVAPAVLFYSFFSRADGTGWNDPVHRTILSLLALFLVLCVAARLARFNVTHELQGTRFFFGWPTTYIGGVLSALFALGLKYGDPAWTAGDPSDDHWMLFGAARLDPAMRLLPWLLIPAGILMVSSVRMPKVRLTGRRWLDALMLVNVICGYTSGLLRRLPEYMVAGGLSYLLISVYYHFTNEEARAARLPPLFPDERDVDEGGRRGKRAHG
jgi:CDP-diacylglycerol--serine O-phosphatidyltransferase